MALLIFSAVFVRLYQKQQLLKQIEAMLKDIEPIATVTEDKLKKLDIIKGQFSEGTSSLDVIVYLYKLIPANISLVNFDYDDKTYDVRFRGRAANMSDVFKLATILESSDKFKNVETRSVSKRRTSKGEIVDFQIRCNFLSE